MKHFVIYYKAKLKLKEFGFTELEAVRIMQKLNQVSQDLKRYNKNLDLISN